LKPFGIQPIRSDLMKEPGKISDQMYRAIFGHELCIAVLTYANPNVYYELAVAQSANRPVVILIEKGTKLPFDVKDFRTIEYDLTISSFESKVYIDQLTDFIREIELNNWKGIDVFESYRSPASPSTTLDAKPYAIRITQPSAGATIHVVTVEGTFATLPAGYELRSLRYYPDQHGFVPHGTVAIDHAKKSWKITRFDVGGEPGDPRGIEICLAGPNARILLDYWNEAHAVHRKAMEIILKHTGQYGQWLPAIKGWPSDLVTCDRIEVTRK